MPNTPAILETSSRFYPLLLLVDDLQPSNLFDATFGTSKVDPHLFVDCTELARQAKFIWKTKQKLPIVLIQMESYDICSETIDELKSSGAFAHLLPKMVVAKNFTSKQKISILEKGAIDVLIDYPIEPDLMFAQIGALQRRIEAYFL